MDIKVNKSDLAKLLVRVAPAAASKSPQAMLTHVLLTAADGKLTAVCTDLVMAISSCVPAQITKSGSIAVVARSFADIAKKLPVGSEARIAVTKDGSRVEVKSGKSVSRIPFAASEEFPSIASVDGKSQTMTMPSSVLARLVRQTSYARDTTEDRVTSCVRLETSVMDGDCYVSAIAADSKRMAVAEEKMGARTQWTAIHLGPRAISDIQKLADGHVEEPVTITSDASYIRFEWSDVTLIAKLYDSSFFPWRKLIPDSHPVTVRIGRELLIESVQRVSLLEDNITASVSVSFDAGEATVSTESTKGASTDVIDCDYSGEKSKSCFSSGTLVAALQSIADDDVELKLGFTGNEQLMIRGVESGFACTAIVMPKRG